MAGSLRMACSRAAWSADDEEKTKPGDDDEQARSVDDHPGDVEAAGTLRRFRYKKADHTEQQPDHDEWKCQDAEAGNEGERQPDTAENYRNDPENAGALGCFRRRVVATPDLPLHVGGHGRPCRTPLYP